MAKVALHILAVLLCGLLLAEGWFPRDYSTAAHAQGDSVYFRETGHTVRGRFLVYWQEHGGLAQQGYPLTEEMLETSDTDGKTYTVQYFERAVFELHPENQPPNDVLLSLLGVFDYKARYPKGIPNERANTDAGTIFFPQTGKHLGGRFREYWQKNGGLAQQGYPISEEFKAISELDGKEYTMQYFERAVFEWHTENNGTPYDVLLSQLGTFRYRAKYLAGNEATTPAKLNIPPPAPGRSQTEPHGSERYLIWSEGITRLNSGPVSGTYDILGLDLKTGQAITVTDAPGDQLNASISGSVVVWQQLMRSCQGNGECAEAGIYAKDLSTGAQFKITDAPSLAAVAGRTVAWVERLENGYRIKSRNLDTGEIVEIAGTTGREASYVRVSDEYMVWLDSAPPTGTGPTRAADSSLKAYDRKARTVQTVLDTRVAAHEPPLTYDLDGARVVWTYRGHVNIKDLRQGTTQSIETYWPVRPVIRGEFVVWNTGPVASDVVGMNLNSLTPYRLVTEPDITGTTLAGNWLVWSYRATPQDSKLVAVSLKEAFKQANSTPVP
ncbi:MAG: hypothetical protein M3437_00600 [Chloroflexota bacterium]|nr:hypothetical protein [Chloroflexota bacterium]MDQ5867613.1 hypothetical protein [Chloroflexota bacterium]